MKDRAYFDFDIMMTRIKSENNFFTTPTKVITL